MGSCKMRNMQSVALTMMGLAFCSTSLYDVIGANSADVSGDGRGDALASLRQQVAQLKQAQTLANTTSYLEKERISGIVRDIRNKIVILSSDTEAYSQRILAFQAEQTPKETVRGRSAESAESWDPSKKKSTNKVSTGGGLVYVRWGRLNCDKPAVQAVQGTSPDQDEYDSEVAVDKGDAKVLYTGSAATGMPTGGSGSELLCIPTKGLWLKDNIAEIQKSTATVYGLEYNFDDHPFTDDGAFRNQDIPCAVCQVRARSHVITIPGVEKCPAGWEKEYQGYLVTGEKGQQKGMYTCLDHSPEEIKGGNSRGAGGQLVPVIAQCDAGLPCPPFKRGHAFDCVVCSM